MNDKVLVDTSVRVSFFRNADQKISHKLKLLLRNGAPVYTGLIVTELIRGAKSQKELSVLEELFNSIGYIEMKENYFSPQANWAVCCRRRVLQ